MTELLTDRAVIAVALMLVAFVLYVLISRRKRNRTTADAAVLEAVQRLSQAGPELRHGLTGEAADQAVKQLYELLKCVAVGITNSKGELLSWDGGANQHYRDLTDQIVSAINDRHREHVKHDKLPCVRRSNCPMRFAVIVPLLVDGAVEGALIVVGGVESKRLTRLADELAKFLCIQLELAKLDESKQQLARAEIRALRAQISPHFMYNALNTISSVIRTDPERARELLQEFADFTRYSFRSAGLFTTLSEELRNIDRYLTIEVARYESKLKVKIRVAPEVLGVAVPYLVLQPLVENAVRHGVSKKPGGGTVAIVVEDGGSDAIITVEDDGVGMDAKRLFADLRDAHKTGSHVGLGNINQRMRSVFGDEYALVVDTDPGQGMKVTLRVPKFHPGVRPELPNYSTDDDEEFDDPSTVAIQPPARHQR